MNAFFVDARWRTRRASLDLNRRSSGPAQLPL
jgi:hypothetical protein